MPLKATFAKVRQKPVNRVSQELAARKRAYNARVKVWLVGKRCAVFPELPATECHHQRGRVADLLLDERFWIPVSAAGHAFVEANREECRHKQAILKDGRRLTLLCDFGQWNTPVKA